MKRINIALDGYSGTGKSSTAREVAKALNYTYVDSGAMYRATTLFFIRNDIDPRDHSQVVQALKEIHLNFDDNEINLNGENVASEIRTMKVNEMVSHISAIKEVRQEMVSQQQEMGHFKGLVMDGRDIGTVVFPEAELKVFMTASADVRALRRQKELAEKGIEEELSAIKANLLERDQIDSNRKESPLVKAEDALELDTSKLTFETQVGKIVEWAKSRIYES
ncbi:(d)CMP kinase [Marinoscillum sp. MHG1-6]|uniref:(d)CMP kinase n=1 Tax=Marinoscillum sp. MHG1-6 TaxID=2959627 RepID=UPI0021584FC0|nr:(d)CMP kinase [Marinoscillum sp. MHG1-6]